RPSCFFFFQAEDGIRAFHVTGVQTCALPIFLRYPPNRPPRAVRVVPEENPLPRLRAAPIPSRAIRLRRDEAARTRAKATPTRPTRTRPRPARASPTPGKATPVPPARTRPRPARAGRILDARSE